MRNGQVKHSSKLCEADLTGELALATWCKRDAPTLDTYLQKPGFYYGFGPRKNQAISLIGPFNTPEQAIESHREAVWEMKHG